MASSIVRTRTNARSGKLALMLATYKLGTNLFGEQTPKADFNVLSGSAIKCGGDENKPYRSLDQNSWPAPAGSSGLEFVSAQTASSLASDKLFRSASIYLLFRISPSMTLSGIATLLRPA